MLLYDLSGHGKLRVSGTDRVRFLNGLFTNDIVKLVPGTGCHAAMLTVKGKLVGDAIILCEEESLAILCVPEVTDKLRDALLRHAIVDDVLIEDLTSTLEQVAVLGEGAGAEIGKRFGEVTALPLYGHARSSIGAGSGAGGVLILRTADLGMDGYRIVGAGVRAALEGCGAFVGEGEAERLRIEAGLPRYGVDMGEEQLPMEARLDDAVSMTKGCYMGQEVIARLSARGHLNKRLCGLRLEGQEPAEKGAKLSAPGREDAGQITSSVVSPRFGVIALGYVHRSAWEPGTVLQVTSSAAGASGPRVATVVDLPFHS